VGYWVHFFNDLCDVVPMMHERVKVEFCFNQVDPDLLEILTGGGWKKPAPYTEVVVYAPTKLKWWERLLRRPQKWDIVLVHNATVRTEEDDG
jgi:hypothetical protein